MLSLIKLVAIIFVICFVFFTLVELIRHRFDFDYFDFEAQLDYIIPLSLSISIVLGVIIFADRQVKEWDVEDLKYEPVGLASLRHEPVGPSIRGMNEELGRHSRLNHSEGAPFRLHPQSKERGSLAARC